MSADLPGVLLVPGWTGSGPRHWQSLWRRRHPEFALAAQRDWDRPEREEWTAALLGAITRAGRPVVLAAHSLGGILVAHAAPRVVPGSVAGALIVAPADCEAAGADEALRGFAPVPLARLPFSAHVIAGSDDPFVTLERARGFAAAWGATFECAGACGHFDSASGLGAWPGGLERLEALRARAIALGA